VSFSSGFTEDKETHVPLAIEALTDKTLTKEWLEQVIKSRMTPIIDGVRIHPIEVTPGTTLFVVEIPKSRRGPHQASDKKYYKRYNFRSAPMEDYEINDVRNRRPLNIFETRIGLVTEAIIAVPRQLPDFAPEPYSAPLWPGMRVTARVWPSFINIEHDGECVARHPSSSAPVLALPERLAPTPALFRAFASFS
jgi:hypothetical protein